MALGLRCPLCWKDSQSLARNRRVTGYNRGAMPAGLHYQIVCPCRHTIELPIDKLGPEFVTQKARSGDSEPVAVVCKYCKRAMNLDLGKPQPGVGLIPLQWISEWEYRGSLLCEDQTCNTPLPLFGPVNPASTPEVQAAEERSWDYNSLVCPKGHLIVSRP
jgi:hypothetical protein